MKTNYQLGKAAKTLKFSKIFSFLFFMLAIGCSETNQSVVRSTPELIDGRLKFSNFQTLDEFIKSKSKDNKPDISEIENALKPLKFVSHDNYYNSRLEEKREINETGRVVYYDEISPYLSKEEDSIRLSKIEDVALAALINESQEIQFGEDEVYRVQNDFVFNFKKDQQYLIINYYKALMDGIAKKPEGSEPVIFNGLKVYKTEVKIKSLGVRNSENGRTGMDCFQNLGTDTRFQGTLKCTWYSASIETLIWKKTGRRCSWGSCNDVWEIQQANKLAQNFDVYAFLGNRPAGRFTLNQTLYNVNAVSYSFSTITGWNTPKYDFSGWICHTADYNGRYLSCQNEFFDFPFLNYNPITCP
jgi:hypothetical protein